MTTATDKEGGVTEFDHNSLSEVTSVDRPGPVGDANLAYDALSRVSTVTDGNGTTTAYTYDDMDRVVTVSTPGLTTTYTYDGLGALTTIADSSGTSTRSYDKLGRVVSEQLPGSRSLSYAYDDNGNLVSLTDPQGTTIYTYDSSNQPATLSVGSLTVTFVVDGTGRLAETQLPNGVDIVRTYDDSGRVEELSVTAPGPVVIDDWIYDYSLLGSDTELLQRTTRRGVVTTFTYDSRDRLVTASSPGDLRTYAWDDNENRTSRTVNGVTSNWAYNAANQITDPGYTYDSAGNRTAAPGQSYTFDDYHRISSFDGTGSSYLGEQASMDSLGTATLTSSVLGPATSGTYRFIMSPSGEPVGITSGGSTFWYYSDAQGSITGLTDATAAVAASYSYTPFGDVQVSGSNAIKDQPVGFVGSYTERSTGLVQLPSGWYDPSTAAMMAVDASAGTVSLLSFASVARGRPKFGTRGDLPHISYKDSGPLGDVSAHGWWENYSGIQARAKVKIKLQAKIFFFKWSNVTKWNEATLRQGGGRGKRVTARYQTQSTRRTLWRSVIDVDIINHRDDAGTLKTKRYLNCGLW